MKRLTEMLGIDSVSRYRRLIDRKNMLVSLLNESADVAIQSPDLRSAAYSVYSRDNDEYEKILDRIERLRKKYPGIK